MRAGEAGPNEELKTLLELPPLSAGMMIKHLFPLSCVGVERPVMDRANKVHWLEGWQLAISSEVAIQKRQGRYYLCMGKL